MLKFLKQAFNLDHVIVTLLDFAFLTLIMMVAVNVSFFNPIERAIESFSMIDVCYQVEKNTQVPDTSRLITIVDISEVKDRDKIAQMVDSIREAEPAVVAFDVIFDPLIGTEEVNMQLLESLSALPTSRYAFMMKEWNQNLHSYTVPFRSYFLFDDFELDGYVNTPESADGSTLRTFSLNRVFLGDTIESFPLKIASDYAPKLAGMRGSDRVIDFSPTYFPEVKWNEISDHTDLLRDRIVIVGALHDLVDNHYTSIGRIAGVKIVAHSVQTLLENRRIIHANVLFTAILSFLIVYFTQVWQHFLFLKMRKSRDKSTFWLFAYRSESLISLLTFFWVCFITFLAFLMFRIYAVSIDMLWMLAGAAIVEEARGFYRAFITVMADRHHIRLFKHSIYYKLSHTKK